MRAAQAAPAVQHPRQRDVVGVDRPPVAFAAASTLRMRRPMTRTSPGGSGPKTRLGERTCWSGSARSAPLGDGSAGFALTRRSERGPLGTNGGGTGTGSPAPRRAAFTAPRRALDRLEDLRIAGAAAEVARERLLDPRRASRRACGRGRRARRGDHPGLAEAALQRAALVEGLLELVESVRRDEPLDGQ